MLGGTWNDENNGSNERAQCLTSNCATLARRNCVQSDPNFPPGPANNADDDDVADDERRRINWEEEEDEMATSQSGKRKLIPHAQKVAPSA